jgi:hypothetical protein
MDYLDFELEIGPGEGREYPVRVVQSPAGEAQGTMLFPFDKLALENRLQALQIALLRSGGKRRRVPSKQERAVQDFGQTLFDTVLSGEVRERYDTSLHEARQQGKGLRLRLEIRPPELAVLPWEFLYDLRRREYVSLCADTPVVRCIDLPQAIEPLSISPPLRILGMGASPVDLKSLEIEREKQRVEEALRKLQVDGLVELTWLQGQTWRDLHRVMRRGPWHIFYFMGHGGFDQVADEGYIALADEDGETDRLTATQLGRMLADHRPLRLVVLNSCEGGTGGKQDIFSSTAAILMGRGILAVLAMQYEITDRAAIEFTRTYARSAAGVLFDIRGREAVEKPEELSIETTGETERVEQLRPDGRDDDRVDLRVSTEAGVWDRLLTSCANSRRSGSLSKSTRRYVGQLYRLCAERRDIKPLVEALDSPDHHVRRFAATALGEMGGVLKITQEEAVLRLIEAATKDEDDGTRWRATWALGAMRPTVYLEQVEGSLREVLEDRTINNSIRWRAAWALGEIKAVGAIDLLAKIAYDKGEDENTRRAAIRALGAIQSPEAEEVVREVADRGKGKLKEVAGWALREIEIRK